MASSSPPPHLIVPPQYEYKERLLVSPVVNSNNNANSSTVHWFLRFETHQQQHITTENTKTSASPFFFTPLSPTDIPALLQSYQAVRILIQVSNTASSTFPFSPLDSVANSGTIIPPLGYHNNGTHNRNNSSVTSSSPAGVRITVDFLLQQNEHEEENDPHDTNDTLEDRFVHLLQEISARRWILASLASVQEPRRLHRFIHQQDIVQVVQQQQQQTKHNNSTNSKMTKRMIHRLSIMLPTDGHAMSAEAMVSFTTVFNPCSSSSRSNKKATSAQAGLWSLISPLTWSNLLLGNHASTQGVGGSGSRRERKRGFWMDIQQEQQQQQQQQDQHQQQYTISQGLYYSRTTSKAVAAQGISLHELVSVDITAPTKQWKSCPLADDTSLVVVVVAPDDNRSTNVSTSVACQKYQRQTTTFDETVIELDMKSIDMTSQCLEVVAAAQQDSLTTSTETVSTTANTRIHSQTGILWQVHLDVERPAGMARHGTILTTVLNHDVHCSVHVSAVQVIPPVITPIWHSLKMHLLFASNATTSATSFKTSTFPHPTVSWNEDGFMVLSFAGTLPPNTAVQLALDYDPAFLPFEQFPADANRGFDLTPVQAHMRRSCDCETKYPFMLYDATATLYSDSVTILAPLPDRSMPFNVLSLSCTLFAFILGSLVNILVRKSSERVKYTLYPDQKPKNLKLQQVKEKIKSRLEWIRQKLAFRKTSNSSSSSSIDSSIATQQAKDDDDATKEKTE